MENGSVPGMGGASQAQPGQRWAPAWSAGLRFPDSRSCSGAQGEWSRAGGRAQGRCCRPSRGVTGACLCNSPCSAQWSLSRGPRKRPTSHLRAATAPAPGGKGGRRRNKGDRAGAASLPAHHVSVRGEARTGAQLGEMVRCCPRPPNPAVPRHDLHKVRVHVQRPRSGGGGRDPGTPPRLEGPGLGGLSRRARFRYWEGGALLLHCCPPAPTPLVQLFRDWCRAAAVSGRAGGGRSGDFSGIAWPPPPARPLEGGGVHGAMAAAVPSLTGAWPSALSCVLRLLLSVSLSCLSLFLGLVNKGGRGHSSSGGAGHRWGT